MTSHSSAEDVEKEIGLGLEKRQSQSHLTEAQEELREAEQPPFVELYLDPENGEPYAKDANGHTLEKVQSRRPSVNDLSAVPNGGLQAWLQVLGSFFIFFNTWGVINTYGSYQTYYETGLLSSSTPSALSWMGSLQACLLSLVGSVTGPIYDAGYVRELLLLGTFLVVFGQMMLSLSTEYYQVLLSQGFCIGIGTGCLFVPGVAIISQYFTTRIATATGLAASGSSLGGVLYPIIFYKLQPKIGFAWTTRALGFIMLVTLIISNLVLKVRVLPAGRRKFFDGSAFKDAPWLFYTFGSFVAFMGLYSPFFYVQSYVIENGIMDPNLAFYLLPILNACSAFGRIVPGFIGDKIGPLNMVIPCALLTGAMCLCLIAAKTSSSVIAVIAFYGLFSGTLVSLPPTIYVRMTKNRAYIGTRIGMAFAIVSIGLLVGTPISGAILKASGFAAVWGFGGALTVLGTMLMIGARIAQGGTTLMKKV